MKRSDALIGGGLLVGGLALLYASRKELAEPEDDEGQIGGQDERNTQYAIPDDYSPGPFSTGNIDASPDTYRIRQPIAQPPQQTQALVSGDPGRYVPVAGQDFSAAPKGYGLYTPAPKGYGLYTPAPAGYGQPDASSQGAFSNLAASAGLVAGGVAANIGLLKVGEAVATRARVPLPEGRVASTLVDPYGVRSAAAAGTSVPALRQVGGETVEAGQERVVRTAAGNAAVKVGEVSFGKRAASFLASYVPVVGIPVGAAIDVYSTKNAENEEERIGWFDALTANTAGDVVQVGTIIAAPGAGVVAQGATGFVTSDAYYAARGKPSVIGSLFANKPSGATAAPSIGGNSGSALMNNVQAVMPANANFNSITSGAVYVPPSANMRSATPANANFSSAQGGAVYVPPKSASVSTIPQASQNASINYTPANANFSSLSGPVSVAPSVSSSASSAKSSGTGKSAPAPVAQKSAPAPQQGGKKTVYTNPQGHKNVKLNPSKKK